MQVTQDGNPAAAPLFETGRVLPVLLKAAWISVLLGLGVQLTVLLSRVLAGAKPKLLSVFVDVAGGVTWATIVCAGVALGSVAARQRSQVMGVLGLISAPLAWAAAKGTQRGTAWMLGQPAETIGPLVYQIGAVKTLEYALLGMLLGRLIRTPASTPRLHALIGFALGLVFGGTILALNVLASPSGTLPAAKIVGTLVNEMLFPVGCSLVIYYVARLSDHKSALERVIAGGG